MKPVSAFKGLCSCGGLISGRTGRCLRCGERPLTLLRVLKELAAVLFIVCLILLVAILIGNL